MLNIIPPTVKDISTTLVSPKPPPFFRIKTSTGGGGARRALAVLGSNNSQLNMNMAKSHLAMTQEGFTTRWNFNPVKEVPLAPGRYQWAPFVSGIKNKNTSTAQDSKLKYINNPAGICSPKPIVFESTNNSNSSQGNNESNCPIPTSASDQENSENEATPETKCKQVLSPSCETLTGSRNNAISGSQMCVTDFFRPAKRKTYNQYEDCHPISGSSSTPSKKKLRTVH